MNVVITGGTKGIGRAIADELAGKGFNLCICSRSKEDLENTVRELKNAYPGVEIFARPTDISQRKEVREFADFVLDKFNGRPDVLINNAGAFIPGLLAEEDEGAMEKMIETNLYSAYHLTRNLLPALLRSSSAYIINMGSVASLLAYPNGGSYSISKFALRGFSMVLREELKETGIKVTTIFPGATWSDSWKGVDLPDSRLMKPADIAKTVSAIFELSEAAVIEEIIVRPQLGDL